MLSNFITEYFSGKTQFNNKYRNRRKQIKEQVFIRDTGIENIINIIN